MKKHSYLKLSLFGMLSLLFFSCKKELNHEKTPDSVEKHTVLNADSATVQFSIALSKAVKNDVDLRNFIKEEALKQINKDYDAFYPFIKDKVVSNGETFREKLLQFTEGNDQLIAIENALPLLTIYIPKLPNGFSAETWKTINEAPIVASGVSNLKIPLFNDGKKIATLEKDEIPGIPTLVVKNNERIKVNENLKLKSASTLNENAYTFIDEAFDGTIKLKANPFVDHSITFGPGELATEVLDAYNIMGVTSDTWQRDHIYYGLTPTNTTGILKRNFKETIRSIKFSESAIAKFMDQNDPRPAPTMTIGGQVYTITNTPDYPKWMDGNFEFKFDVLINNTAGLGTTVTKYISLDPDLMFGMFYEYVGREFFPIYKWKLQFIIDNEVSVDIPLVTWDLETNGASWKFLVSEVDDQQTTTRTETTTTEFATNFEFNPLLNSVAKIGLKFGGSAKTTNQNTYSVVTQLNSDDLGTLELNFSDPVIKSHVTGNRYTMYAIKNPYLEIVVMPKAYY